MSKAVVIAPVYNYYPILVHALMFQSARDWELLLLHDGPNETGLKDSLQRLEEPRLRYYETRKRHNDWGHSLRALALSQVKEEPIDADFVVVTNADNYYAPGFLEMCLAAFKPETMAVCCGMAHNHREWMPIASEPVFGRIDCGCLVVRREAALTVGWPSRDYAADWAFVSALIERYGSDRLTRIPNLLFVHN